MNAPPKALRTITVTLGTVASANACTSLAPWRMTPSRSWREPGRKPGVSTSTSSGSPKALHSAHEARGLLRGVRVEHAAKVAGLVGDDPDRAALEARERADHVARPPRADLHQAPAVDERGGDVADVIDLARLRRHGPVGRGASGAATVGHSCGETPACWGR